mmetsp:Transcript_33688/g.107649  ORF Transcript_33688/g.107649 Transcript_33688/m.107649 type:complete len:464 (-) Transcript_33688:89-1480(-)
MSAMLGVVHADLLDLLGDADADGPADDEHPDGDVAAGPADVGEDEEDAGAEGAAVAAVEDAGAVVLAVVVGVVGFVVVELGGEEGRGDDAPRAAGAVDGEGVDDVVDFELDEEHGGAEVDGGRDEAGKEGAPEVGGGAARGDGDEAREDAVVGGSGVDDVGHGVLEEDARQAARRRGDRRGHEDVGGDAAVADDRERRGAVEAVPADPQNEDAEGLEDRRLLLEVDGARPEAALAGADEDAGDDRRDAPGHVHDAGPREVDHPAAPDKPLLPPGAELPVRRPPHVHHRRVDVPHEHHRVSHVRRERRALRHGPRDDRRRRTRERPLEHPVFLQDELGMRRVRQRRRVLAGADAGVEEARTAVEPVLPRPAVPAHERVGPEREGVAGPPPHEGGDRRVEDVLDQDILRVLHLDGPHFQHREARLHEEDQDRPEEEPEGVDIFLGCGGLLQLRHARRERREFVFV